MRAVPAVSIKGTLGPGPVGFGEPGTGAGRRVFVWPGENIFRERDRRETVEGLPPLGLPI
ncbi:hypothetical protein B1T44_29775 [Mycobacterium persicum]|nr:hypothetical protein B1T44_29775 [Mycobacterium persicum]